MEDFSWSVKKVVPFFFRDLLPLLMYRSVGIPPSLYRKLSTRPLISEQISVQATRG